MGGDPSKIFEQMFGMNFSGRQENNIKPLIEVIELELEDFYNGKQFTHKLSKDTVLNKMGEIDNTGICICQDCNGKGKKNILRQLGPGMMQQMQVVCGTCKGKGSSIKKGFKMGKITEDIDINVIAGSKNEHQMVLEGKGNYD